MREKKTIWKEWEKDTKVKLEKKKAEFIIQVFQLSPELLLNTASAARYPFCPKHG